MSFSPSKSPSASPSTAAPDFYTLTDSFNDNSLDGAKWYADTSTCTIEETGGKVVVTPVASQAFTYAGYISQNHYNLVGSYALIEVPLVGTEGYTTLNVGTPQSFNFSITMFHNDGKLWWKRLYPDSSSRTNYITYNAF